MGKLIICQTANECPGCVLCCMPYGHLAKIDIQIFYKKLGSGHSIKGSVHW